jgi:hypothetical protein
MLIDLIEVINDYSYRVVTGQSLGSHQAVSGCHQEVHICINYVPFSSRVFDLIEVTNNHKDMLGFGQSSGSH